MQPSKPLTVDAHVDTLWVLSEMARQTDPTVLRERMNFGGLDKVTLVLYISDHWQDQLGFARTGNALARMINLAKIHFHQRHFLAIEGGRLLGPDIFPRLGDFASCGIKYLTLVHNYNIPWAGSGTDPLDNNRGLNELGKNVVRICEEMDVLVDVSHASDATVRDVLMVASKPVIASHSGCRARFFHVRNLTDEQIEAIAETGGVVHVPFARRFVGDREGIIEHIDHITQLTGSCEFVGIGSDLDGATMVHGVTGAESWADVVIGPLLKRGYGDADVAMICGGNTLRVYGETV